MSQEESTVSEQEEFFDLAPEDNRPWVIQKATGIARFAVRRPLGFFGGVNVLFFLIIAVFAPWLAPIDPYKQSLAMRFAEPSTTHWVGTDYVGRDIASRLIYGARLSLFVGMGTVILSGLFGTILGVMWAYLGKTFDAFMSMMVTAGLALPDLVLLIIAAQIARQAEISEIFSIVVTLSFTRMWGVTRIYRSAALEVRSRPFVEAAESYGAGAVRAMGKHVLPNVLPLIILSSTLALPNAILAEAGLSFLGFGPAGEPSWGQMFAGEASEYFRRQVWMLWAPGLTIGLTVMGFNFWGDAMRDLLDPRLRGTT